MKELSIEQKAKAYDKALERARKLLENSKGMILKKWLWNIFPELKESRDNRIMKVIRGWIYTRPASFFDNGISKEEILAWLEKQGEQKPADSYCQENCKGFQETGKCFADGDCKAKREAESNDKNEPKFHEGDWVVSGYFVTQIREIAGDGYVNSHNGFIPFESAKYYHIWTIQDAKDGDVLAMSAGAFIYNGNNGGGSCPGCYCGINTLGNFKVGVEHHWTGKPVFPATKEQRDTLFAKMKEAGYIYDFEKKELKKLGQPEVTKTSDQEEIAEIPFGAKDSELQEATYFIPKGLHAEIDDDKVVIKKGEKPTAWSEEDETYLDLINTAIKLYYTDDKGKDNPWREELLRWFKSLKDRVQPQSNWKPSEEQVKAFEHFVRSIGESGYASPYENNTKFLYSLLNDLKKLTE